ncbi:hypothetical protein NLU13_0682 [Sarocladium strictum]|uniref:Uncharacterized protein n=1 Tax=Sarocladium strictum TaxID=5046 RepID=A0AA39GQA2_SARSR|nr:hypothetical protein NLU13_0682 [Sarocladium strictum]
MALKGTRPATPLLFFLYPSLFFRSANRPIPLCYSQARKASSTTSPDPDHVSTVNELPESRLNPRPDDYGAANFADKAILTLYAGRGGNGCVSFHREAFLPDGPPNGGDGGAGGNVYIQAAHGETSLHKLSRRRFIRAGRGKHGQGSAKSGSRGEDVIITVPVGTVVREIERTDPAAEEAEIFSLFRAAQRQRKKQERIAEDARRMQLKKERLAREAAQAAAIEAGEELESSTSDVANDEVEEAEEEWEEEEELRREEDEEDPDADDPQREKWLLYPGMSKSEMRSAEFPRLPRRDRVLQQPPAPIYLDLSRPTERPYLLATGGIGGLGNPHFTSRSIAKPIFATKGDDAVTLKVELELKLLADVGLVGLPNAGKSTLLRAITNSRTRVGNWAFTTLQPNIGTVVLDKYSGRPTVSLKPSLSPTDDAESGPRTRFTIADIPGLIEGAHLDKGLGIAFLRHVERAGVLAFVVDLSAGNAVNALNALWREVGLYAEMRENEERAREVDSLVHWDMASDSTGPINLMNSSGPAPPSNTTPVQEIAGKPWFVVATKADLPDTQENYKELQEYLDRVTKGEVPHPSGAEESAWTRDCRAIPVSAINGQGTDRIVHWVAGLLAE